MSGSGGLTEDQKRRIEENRQKALAKRALKSSQSPVKSNNNQASWQNSSKNAGPKSGSLPNQHSTSTWHGKSNSGGNGVQGSFQSGAGFKGNQYSQQSGLNRNSLSNQINKHSAQTLVNQDSGGVISNQNKTCISTGTYKPYDGSQSSSSSNSSHKPINTLSSGQALSTNSGGTYKPFNSAQGVSSTNSAQGMFNTNSAQAMSRTNSAHTVSNTNNACHGNLNKLSNTSSGVSSQGASSTNNSGKPYGTIQSNNPPSVSQSANKPVNMFANVKPVKGQCILISRERFEVKVGYSQPLIELFKRMNTKLYDAVTKKWSFKLEEYDTFMKEALVLRPHVTIEPLPKAILQVFSSQLKGVYPSRDIPNADLSAIDASLVSSLLPFQREGVNFGVSKNGRVLIADDMGLGKTIQAICLSCYYRDEWPLLVIVPSSVRFDWAQQIRRWVPSIDPQEISVAVTGKDSSSSQVNIMTYDLVARKAKYLQDKRFQVVVVDECHLLKNYKTARCKAAMPILQNARRVILLSGTPALSRPSELYTQISAITPFLFKYQDFGIRYCDGKQQPWGWDFSGSSNMAELQILLEERIMIRRLKKNVLTQLPSKVRQMVLLDPSAIKSTKDLKKASKVMDLKNLKGMERRGALLEYFHHTSTAKVEAVKDYVQDLLEADRKFLLFAHHQEFLDSVEDLARSKLGSNYIRIDGKTSPEQRNYYCRKFQENPDYKMALLSITAANAGINLSSASLVVFGELFWNPGILVQAEDRAHRMGQQDMVNVQYLVAQNTADDQIWPLVQKKLDVLNKAGLSKDNFSDADTTMHKDSKQTDLMQFFEESFIEEGDSFTEDTNEKQSQSADIEPESKKSGMGGSLFNYFSSTKTSIQTGSGVKECKGDKLSISHKGVNQDNFEGDDLDIMMGDDDWDDQEFDEPQQKKLRT